MAAFVRFAAAHARAGILAKVAAALKPTAVQETRLVQFLMQRPNDF
jgi:hypothetical protein